MYIDMYLAFADAAEAESVLYTATPTAWDEDGNPTEFSRKPNYQNIDVLGTVYQPAPDPMPEDYQPVPYPAPNYGVNVRLVKGLEDPAPLLAYSVNPAPAPQRVWA